MDPQTPLGLPLAENKKATRDFFLAAGAGGGTSPDDDDSDDDNDDHDIHDAEKTIRNGPKTIRKCCEIGPKMVQMATQKVAFIFSAGCRVSSYFRSSSLRSTSTRSNFSTILMMRATPLRKKKMTALFRSKPRSAALIGAVL